MAGIKTLSGRWVECSEDEAKEYAEYLEKRYSRLHRRTRERMISERIILTKGDDGDECNGADNRSEC